MGNIIDIVNYLTSTLDKDLGKLVELKKIIMDSEPESELYVFGLGPHHPDGHVTFSFNKPISVGSWSITKDGYNSKDVATAHLENVLSLSSFFTYLLKMKLFSLIDSCYYCHWDCSCHWRVYCNLSKSAFNFFFSFLSFEIFYLFI